MRNPTIRHDADLRIWKLILALTVAFFLTVPLLAASSSPDSAAQQKIQKNLHNKKYEGITVSVQDGVATLSGTADFYGAKLDALKSARKTDGVHSVVDHVAVATPNPAPTDQQIQQKLLGAIQMSRVGFGQVFDAISVQVKDGVAMLGGHAVDYPSKNAAVSIAQYTPGVKGVVDHIQLDPLSPSDDHIRMAEFNSIYSYAPLSEYALSPLRPIRISVQNGNVTLYGIVNSQMDKEAAGLRANIVRGVFHVTNDLVVASTPQQKK